MTSQNIKTFILVLLSIIITAFVTCVICKNNSKDDITDNTRSLTTICMDYDTIQPAVLTTELVKTMVTTFKGKQLNNIQTATTDAVPKDAQSIWFDLETLKKFLYHIEHNVDKNSTDPRAKNLGVRIYYAAYPKNADMKRLWESQNDTTCSFNPNYEKLHTLVMIPTITGQGGANYDFNPLDVNSYNGFVNMKKDGNYSYLNTDYSILTLGTCQYPNNSSLNISNSSNISARNHGTLMPPENPVGIAF